VTFVERHRPTADALRAVARTLGVEEQVAVICAGAEHAPARVAGRFDLVFADPPYAHAYPVALFAALREAHAIDAATTVVYEHAARSAPPNDPGMRVERTERYGEVALSFLRPVAGAA
jgi:16S rRNA G966 N2-methylase RsmD